jgi:hypothetical protein
VADPQAFSTRLKLPQKAGNGLERKLSLPSPFLGG